MLSSFSRWHLAAHAWWSGLSCALAVLFVIGMLWPSTWTHAPVAASDGVNELWRWTSALLVAPVLETALMAGLAAGFRREHSGLAWRAALLATPMAVLHLLNNWQNMLAAWPVFWIQAMLYLELRRRGHDLLTACTPVVVVHMLHNACTLTVASLLLGMPDSTG